MLKKALLICAIAGVTLFTSGCEKCWEMTDGGSVQNDWDTFIAEDDAYCADLKPSIKRWWNEEKARWPKFRKTCIDAESCYEQSIDAKAKSEK